MRQSAKTANALFDLVVASIFLAALIGWETTWTIITSTPLFAYVVAGIIMLALGVKSNRYGKFVYGIVFLVITIMTFIK